MIWEAALSSKEAALPKDRAQELRTDLARKVAQSIGSAEILPTAVPGRRTAPTALISRTYEPSVAVVVQGRRRVELGRTTFFYDESQFLLTSVDLPVISQIVEASEKSPYLCLRLKLELPMVREVLSREEIHVAETRSNHPAMTTAETTVEFLSAFSRLLDLLSAPRDIPLSAS